MALRLPAYTNERELADWLLRDLALTAQLLELDLTDCVVLDRFWFHDNIGWCHNLERLRCIGCPHIPSLLFQTLCEKVQTLKHIEFTLATLPDDIRRELRRLQQFRRQQETRHRVMTLRRVYVEVGGGYNCMLLRFLLACFPAVQSLHIHLLRGTFTKAVQDIVRILETSSYLERFTFTSEVPSTMQQVPFESADFLIWSLVCGNVTYWQFGASSSCARLQDLAAESQCRSLPSQLLLVVEHDHDLVTGNIDDATHGHMWSHVSCLCLVLFPGQSLCTTYPIAEEVYVDALQNFFSAMHHIVELNVSSFHFGPGVDLVRLLQEGDLGALQALSAAPCGLRHPRALRRLARLCQNLQDLDVRLERQGRFNECSTCSIEWHVDQDGLAALHEDVPWYRCGLHRLTLSDLPRLESLRFLEQSQVVELRLSGCIPLSHPDFLDIGELLSKNQSLRYLVLKDDDLPIESTPLMASLWKVQLLEYLCLVSGACLSSLVVGTKIRVLASALPRLRCFHVHYRDIDDDLEKRTTWMRRGDTAQGGVLIEDSPCILCSTATFIGLSKPQNRGFRVTP